MRGTEEVRDGDSVFCVEFTSGQRALLWWKGMNTFCLTRKCPVVNVFFSLNSLPLFTFAGAKIISSSPFHAAC